MSFTSLYGPNERTIANSYYTGDLARLGKTGSSITSVERTPQIKSRGYRIELGEIEAALHSLPSLSDCAVVAGPSQGFEGVAIPTWTFPTKRWCPNDSRRSTASPALSVSLRGKAEVLQISTGQARRGQ